MKQLIAMLAAGTLLLCTACGQNEAAFETKEPQALRAAVTVPAEEPVTQAQQTTAAAEEQTAVIPAVTAETVPELTEPPVTTAAGTKPAAAKPAAQKQAAVSPSAGAAETPVSDAQPQTEPDAPQADAPAEEPVTQTEPEDSDTPAETAVTVITTAAAKKTSATTAASSAAAAAPETAAASVTTAAAVPVITREKPAVDTAALDKLVKQYARGCAVELYSLEGTVLYAHRANTLISGASLIKLPYVYYCCTQIEAGTAKLTDTMTYTASFAQGGSGILRNKSYGTKYTLAQLMDYALRYSDNTAYYMLVTKFGAKGFNQMVKDWGYQNISISVSSRFPALTAAFMTDAADVCAAQCGRMLGECMARAGQLRAQLYESDHRWDG